VKVRATYRLQLNRGFTFADAEAILPYLDALGISHLYASPVTAAQPGSPHGYDVIDPTRINPELGGEAGLRRLAAALRARRMGLILDIVPNHMSVTGGANAWWNDVLANGRESEFARFFDIDWGEKILLPFLGDPPAAALANGDLALERDADGRRWLVAYGRDRYPVTGDGEDVAELLGRQHYELADWREADRRLNWRRFFTISGLAGIRVEDEAVFAATHKLYFRLHDEGVIDGVRVDHVDGLADPASYCRRLRARMPGAWIVVEKILAAGEALPEGWGVDGTSGYDFMDEAGRLLHEPAGAAPLAAHWKKLSGRPADFAGEERQARRELLGGELAGQLDRCVRAFAEQLGRPPEEVRSALVAMLTVFPVYRTYGGAEDAAVVETVRGKVGASPLVEAILAADGEPARRLRQLSAPLSAKAVEDTAFYRHGRLLSRNEVGAEPSAFAMTVADFHAAMAARAERWPRAMLATATHDHKRGEDVRARLAVLSELPGEWIAATERWRAINRAIAEGVDPGDEYLFYQTLVGAWPSGAADGLAERLWGWFEKALREAKLRSSWTEPDTEYESRCRAFAEAALDPVRSRAFLADVRAFARRLAPAGEANALVQAFLRCAAPGVPDCYQGCEFADFSLVDPDNRRSVDFAARAAALGAGGDGFDAVKQALIARLLRLRAEQPRLWDEGSWEPVAAEGPRARHLLAFRRGRGDVAMLGAAALRCASELVAAGGRTPRRDWWGETRLRTDGAPLAADLFEHLPVHLAITG